MKHFSGAKPFASSKAGNPSDTLLRDSKPAPQAARRAVVVKTAGLDDNGYTYQANAAPQHKRVVRTAVAAAEQYVERDPTTNPAAAAHRPAAAAIKPNVSSHRSSRAHQRSRQLVRVASHSIDLGSDLSSDTDQSDVDAKSPKNASLRQPKHTSQPAGSCPTAAAAAAGSATHAQPQRKQHHKKQGRNPHPDTPPATATAAAEAAAAAGGASQGGRTRRQGSQTKSALIAVASLVLLAACGSTIRAVSGWQRGASNLYPNAATADPSAAAFTIGADVAEGPLDSGSSWLSYTPFATSRQPAPGAAAAAAVGPPGWLPRGWQRFGGQLSSTAQHVLSRMGSARGATGPTSSAHAAPSSSSSEKRPVTAIRAASTGAAAAAASPAGSSSSSGSSTGTAGSIKLYAVVDAGAPSPFVSHSPKGSKGLDWSADWGDVLKHMAQRLEWTDERFNLQVMTQDELKTNAAARQALSSALSTSNPSSSGSSSSSTSTSPMFVGIGITDADVAAFLSKATAQLPTALFWNSDPSLGSTSRVDGYAPETAGPFAKLLAQNVGFSKEAKAAEVMKTLDILWGRNTSDDLLYIWLVLLNQYVTPVPMVANTTKGTDLASLYCMIKNCGQKIVDCVSDKTCKGGLDCLQGCAFNDQVCQYRCIVSYETPQFEQFALCILQLHNCRGLNAEIPMRPDPAPMTKWRGQSLTHETAEDLFIGWLSKGPQMPNGDPQLMPYSWLVAAGKNPAYDAFGCQHQLYYRGKGKGQLWYEPVFRVTTLEGQEVWRKRRYRVRRGKTPGTFHYSVLDNGVTSNEYWRIIDCAEDLAYCLFYYSGAASAAGMSYTGAVLGTRDGLWPGAYTERIHGALRQAGIEPWELSMPDNSRCADAPLQPVAA